MRGADHDTQALACSPTSSARNADSRPPIAGLVRANTQLSQLCALAAPYGLLTGLPAYLQRRSTVHLSFLNPSPLLPAPTHLELINDGGVGWDRLSYRQQNSQVSDERSCGNGQLSITLLGQHYLYRTSNAREAALSTRNAVLLFVPRT